MLHLTQEDIELAIGPDEHSILNMLNDIEKNYINSYASLYSVGSYERDKFLRGIEIARDSIYLSVKYRIIAETERKAHLDGVH